MTDLPDVRVGQVWADNDKRGYGRQITVVDLIDSRDTNDKVIRKAVVEDRFGNRTRIRADRFRPTSNGYRLVQDVDGGDPS